MEDRAKMHISAIIHNEEKLFGDDVVTPPRTTSTTNRDVTRSISKKLLDWGVEERGTYRMTLILQRPN